MTRWGARRRTLILMRLIFGLLFAVALAYGQKLELGARVGVGAFAAEDLQTRTYGNAGVEACGWCSRRFSLFGEYSHWEETSGKFSTRIQRSDLAAGGLRIQGGRRIRPFFDIGIAGGQDRYVYSGGSGAHSLCGLVLGGGAAVSIRERWYVRPQVRLYALSGFHAAASVGVGIGYRF